MSDSSSSSVLVTVVGDNPSRDPSATCEGCGTVGTVGRATRMDAGGAVTEEHRFCARCWPEWSAFYRARWQDEARRATLKWWDQPRDAPPEEPPPAWGMSFDSATWHGILEYVGTLTMQARYYRNSPSREYLARLAADIRARAADREGPMPIEVRSFLAEYGDPEDRG
jgi:hypothetical protein